MTAMHEPRLKHLVLKLRAARVPVKKIVDQTGVPRSTVYEWLLQNPDAKREEPTATHKDMSLKRRALELRAEGTPVKAIAQEINAPVQTVYFWTRQARIRSMSLLEKVKNDARTLSETVDQYDDAAMTKALKDLARRVESALKGLAM